MQRRHFLSALAFAPLALAFAPSRVRATTAANVDIAALQSGWMALLAPGAKVASFGTRVSHTRDEWRKTLSPESYHVLREEGTERPGTSPLNFEKRAGVFVCAGCELPLFTSAMKYDSGTGWPSFFTTIPGAFGTKTDRLLGIPRTEYHCSRCDGHHGHVFDDGPPPTRERWCENGVAMRFIPKG